MKSIARTALTLLLCGMAAHAGVVRPAPDFRLDGIPKSLRSFRKQTVVLLITDKAKNSEFRKQVALLHTLYGQFSAENVIFVAAIKNGPAEVRSNIPFAIAANPAQVAADYGVTGRFAIVVIGVDGNLDMITAKPVPATRVRDMIFNNFETQSNARKLPAL